MSDKKETQWPKEEEQTTQWLKEEEQTTQWPSVLLLLAIVLSVLLRFTDSDYPLVSSSSSCKAEVQSVEYFFMKMFNRKGDVLPQMSI
jgi:ABC-type phosphate/phosphonate transport system permease subunit